VKREKELAEKRKNDPPLELASDHPVRKLISRFRKISDRNQNVDPEMGGGHAEDGGEDALTPNNLAAGNHTPSAQTVTVNESAGSHSKSKWNMMMAGAASATPGKLAPAAADGKAAAPKTTAPTAVFKAGQLEPSASAPAVSKPASRWGKMFARQPETIPEKDEDATSTSTSTAADARSPREPATYEAALTQRDIAVSVVGRGSLTPAEQQLVQCLCDIKLEIKQEISVLNEKMTKIDDQIGNILKMFTASASLPAPPTPTSVSSCATTTASSGSGGSGGGNMAAARSPRSSLVPSPPAPSSYSDYARPGSSSDAPCRTITPPSPSSATDKSSSGSEASGTTKRSRRKKGSTNRMRVAPSEQKAVVAPTSAGSAPDDEDRLPIKDRDLDIL